MSVKSLFTVGTAIVAYGISVSAGAVPLAFDLSGPSGTAIFQLDSKPTPDFFSTFLGSDQFGFRDVVGIYGGTRGTASTISFGNGLFSILSVTAPNLGFTQFIAPTLFTGSPSAPVFATGSFTLINPFFGNANLSISQAQGTVPEPAAWGLMIVGFSGIGMALRSRRGSHAVRTYHNV
ncbi:PEPxxWA-CTERM sorting domain-containing protein [Polymorphobacter megasporae]|uniref:PEPxxWA-CTERM sorting domain-containing protein n=1 Tax=Glacieibacterium megasporae TaxID=2835787 RepID=UPI001C1E4924|nr:PEPxxWA-CTERM sorting domain-containing protein [Polymorphobacter megasporae]UAJ12306.1 PEPxxWA-CTERM sorting domain-containing protein [Polymorphobacter megasporae]